MVVAQNPNPVSQTQNSSNPTPVPAPTRVPYVAMDFPGGGSTADVPVPTPVVPELPPESAAQQRSEPLPIPGEGSSSRAKITEGIGLAVSPSFDTTFQEVTQRQRFAEEASYIDDESDVSTDVENQERLDAIEEALVSNRNNATNIVARRRAQRELQNFRISRYGRPDAREQVTQFRQDFTIPGSGAFVANILEGGSGAPLYNQSRGIVQYPDLSAVDLVPVAGTTTLGIELSESGFTRGELAQLGISAGLDVVSFIPPTRLASGASTLTRGITPPSGAVTTSTQRLFNREYMKLLSEGLSDDYARSLAQNRVRQSFEAGSSQTRNAINTEYTRLRSEGLDPDVASSLAQELGTQRQGSAGSFQPQLELEGIGNLQGVQRSVNTDVTPDIIYGGSGRVGGRGVGIDDDLPSGGGGATFRTQSGTLIDATGSIIDEAPHPTSFRARERASGPQASFDDLLTDTPTTTRESGLLVAERPATQQFDEFEDVLIELESMPLARDPQSVHLYSRARGPLPEPEDYVATQRAPLQDQPRLFDLADESVTTTPSGIIIPSRSVARSASVFDAPDIMPAASAFEDPIARPQEITSISPAVSTRESIDMSAAPRIDDGVIADPAFSTGVTTGIEPAVRIKEGTGAEPVVRIEESTITEPGVRAEETTGVEPGGRIEEDVFSPRPRPRPRDDDSDNSSRQQQRKTLDAQTADPVVQWDANTKYRLELDDGDLVSESNDSNNVESFRVLQGDPRTVNRDYYANNLWIRGGGQPPLAIERRIRNVDNALEDQLFTVQHTTNTNAKSGVAALADGYDKFQSGIASAIELPSKLSQEVSSSIDNVDEMFDDSDESSNMTDDLSNPYTYDTDIISMDDNYDPKTAPEDQYIVNENAFGNVGVGRYMGSQNENRQYSNNTPEDQLFSNTLNRVRTEVVGSRPGPTASTPTVGQGIQGPLLHGSSIRQETVQQNPLVAAQTQAINEAFPAERKRSIGERLVSPFVNVDRVRELRAQNQAGQGIQNTQNTDVTGNPEQIENPFGQSVYTQQNTGIGGRAISRARSAVSRFVGLPNNRTDQYFRNQPTAEWDGRTRYTLNLNSGELVSQPLDDTNLHTYRVSNANPAALGQNFVANNLIVGPGGTPQNIPIRRRTANRTLSGNAAPEDIVFNKSKPKDSEEEEYYSTESDDYYVDRYGTDDDTDETKSKKSFFGRFSKKNKDSAPPEDQYFKNYSIDDSEMEVTQNGPSRNLFDAENDDDPNESIADSNTSSAMFSFNNEQGEQNIAEGSKDFDIAEGADDNVNTYESMESAVDRVAFGTFGEGAATAQQTQQPVNNIQTAPLSVEAHVDQLAGGVFGGGEQQAPIQDDMPDLQTTAAVDRIAFGTFGSDDVKPEDSINKIRYNPTTRRADIDGDGRKETVTEDDSIGDLLYAGVFGQDFDNNGLPWSAQANHEESTREEINSADQVVGNAQMIDKKRLQRDGNVSPEDQIFVQTLDGPVHASEVAREVDSVNTFSNMPGYESMQESGGSYTEQSISGDNIPVDDIVVGVSSDSGLPSSVDYNPSESDLLRGISQETNVNQSGLILGSNDIGADSSQYSNFNEYLVGRQPQANSTVISVADETPNMQQNAAVVSQPAVVQPQQPEVVQPQPVVIQTTPQPQPQVVMVQPAQRPTRAAVPAVAPEDQLFSNALNNVQPNATSTVQSEPARPVLADVLNSGTRPISQVSQQRVGVVQNVQPETLSDQQQQPIVQQQQQVPQTTQATQATQVPQTTQVPQVPTMAPNSVITPGEIVQGNNLPTVTLQQPGPAQIVRPSNLVVPPQDQIFSKSEESTSSISDVRNNDYGMSNFGNKRDAELSELAKNESAPEDLRNWAEQRLVERGRTIDKLPDSTQPEDLYLSRNEFEGTEASKYLEEYNNARGVDAKERIRRQIKNESVVSLNLNNRITGHLLEDGSVLYSTGSMQSGFALHQGNEELEEFAESRFRDSGYVIGEPVTRQPSVEQIAESVESNVIIDDEPDVEPDTQPEITPDVAQSEVISTETTDNIAQTLLRDAGEQASNYDDFTSLRRNAEIREVLEHDDGSVEEIMYFEDGTVARLRYEDNELVGGGAFDTISPDEFTSLVNEARGVESVVSVSRTETPDTPDTSEFVSDIETSPELSTDDESLETQELERELRSGQSVAAGYSRALKRRPSSADILNRIRQESSSSASIENEDGTTTEIHMFSDESGGSLLAIKLDDDGLPVSKNEIKTIRAGTKAYDNAINVLEYSQRDEAEREDVPESIEQSIDEIEDPSTGRPNILSSEHIERVGDLLAANEKKIEIAQKLGVTRGTLDNFIEENAEELADAFVERENKRTAAEESSGERGRPRVLTMDERDEIFKALNHDDPAIRKSAQELANEKKVHLNTISNAKRNVENKIYREFHEADIDSEEAIEKFSEEYGVDALVIESIVSQDRAIIEDDDDTVGDRTSSAFLGPDNDNDGIPSSIENNVAQNVERVENILIPDGTRLPSESRSDAEITEDFTEQVVGSRQLEPDESFVSGETVDFDDEVVSTPEESVVPLSRMERGKYEELRLRSSGEFPSLPLSESEQALYQEYVARTEATVPEETVDSNDEVPESTEELQRPATSEDLSNIDDNTRAIYESYRARVENPEAAPLSDSERALYESYRSRIEQRAESSNITEPTDDETDVIPFESPERNIDTPSEDLERLESSQRYNDIDVELEKSRIYGQMDFVNAVRNAANNQYENINVNRLKEYVENPDNIGEITSGRADVEQFIEQNNIEDDNERFIAERNNHDVLSDTYAEFIRKIETIDGVENQQRDGNIPNGTKYTEEKAVESFDKLAFVRDIVGSVPAENIDINKLKEDIASDNVRDKDAYILDRDYQAPESETNVDTELLLENMLALGDIESSLRDTVEETNERSYARSTGDTRSLVGNEPSEQYGSPQSREGDDMFGGEPAGGDPLAGDGDDDGESDGVSSETTSDKSADGFQRRARCSLTDPSLFEFVDPKRQKVEERTLVRLTRQASISDAERDRVENQIEEIETRLKARSIDPTEHNEVRRNLERDKRRLREINNPEARDYLRARLDELEQKKHDRPHVSNAKAQADFNRLDDLYREQRVTPQESERYSRLQRDINEIEKIYENDYLSDTSFRNLDTSIRTISARLEPLENENEINALQESIAVKEQELQLPVLNPTEKSRLVLQKNQLEQSLRDFESRGFLCERYKNVQKLIKGHRDRGAKPPKSLTDERKSLELSVFTSESEREAEERASRVVTGSQTLRDRARGLFIQGSAEQQVNIQRNLERRRERRESQRDALSAEEARLRLEERRLRLRGVRQREDLRAFDTSIGLDDFVGAVGRSPLTSRRRGRRSSETDIERRLADNLGGFRGPRTARNDTFVSNGVAAQARQQAELSFVN